VDTREQVEQCPLCRGRHTAFETWTDGEEQLVYRRCAQCGLVFQSPRPTQEFLSRYYTEGYRTQVQGTEDVTMKDLRIQAGRARFLAAFCHGVMPNISRHLDIGSSSGQLLKAISAASGGASVGVEPGDTYREAAMVDGYRVYPSLDAMDEAGEERFQLISMSHVLEHIPDPYVYLSELRKNWLAPDGYLLVEVPNLYGHHAYELSHLTAFTPGTLRLLLRGAGYRVMRIRTHGEPRSSILRLYLTVLAQADGSSLPRESLRRFAALTPLRRKIGLALYNGFTEHLPSRTWRPFPELDEEQ